MYSVKCSNAIMQHSVRKCLQCSAMQCSAVQCSAVQSAEQCNAVSLELLPASLLRLDQQNNQITPDDKLTVLCEITIDGKDVQQSGQAQVMDTAGVCTAGVYISGGASDFS